MPASHFSVSNHVARTLRKEEQASGGFGTSPHGMLHFDELGTGRMVWADQIEGQIRMIQDQRQLIIEVFAGG
jgi:hypothetical protein